MTWRSDYRRVLRSPRWRALKRRLIKESGSRCGRCKQVKRSLQLHHKDYDRLGKELDSDVELVCNRCHKLADKERAGRGRIRSAKALYNARLNGWANKVYGKGWKEEMEFASVAEEFKGWLSDQ